MGAVVVATKMRQRLSSGWFSPRNMKCHEQLSLSYNHRRTQGVLTPNGKIALYTLWTGAEVGDLYRKRIVDKNGPIVKNEPVYLYVGLPL